MFNFLNLATIKQNSHNIRMVLRIGEEAMPSSTLTAIH